MTTIHKMLRTLQFWFGLALFLTTASPAGAASLTLNTDDVPPLATDNMSGYHNQLIVEAFARLNMDAEVLMVPSQRALVNADRGVDDGTLPRIAGLEKEFPNLRQVPEKIMDYEFTAFTLRDDITIRTWDDLRPYSIAYVRGWKIFEHNTVGFPSVIRTARPEQLFHLLAKRRADVVLLERWQGLYTARTIGLKGVRAMSPPLASREMFVYLHKRHEALVHPLAKALKAMKSDGAYARIDGQTLHPLLSKLHP